MCNTSKHVALFNKVINFHLSIVPGKAGKKPGMVHSDLSLCHVTITYSSHWLRLHGVVTNYFNCLVAMLKMSAILNLFMPEMNPLSELLSNPCSLYYTAIYVN